MGWVILVAYAKQVSAIPIYRTPLTSVKRAYNILKFCQCSEKFQSFNILTFPHSYMLFSMLKRCITEIRKQIDHFFPASRIPLFYKRCQDIGCMVHVRSLVWEKSTATVGSLTSTKLFPQKKHA